MDLVKLPYEYVSSLCRVGWYRGVFDEIKTFVIFIGYPRSAHTLVGFLLDAHPNAAVASQKSALRYLKHHFTKQQIFDVLLQNSRRVAKIGRGDRLYSYQVPNQWQGRFTVLRVVGDCTGFTRMRRNPSLLKSLQRMLKPVELKLVHCIRNPYDNISTMRFRSGEKLEETIERYFSMCHRVEGIKNDFGTSAVHELWHENLVAEPEATLRALCGFLGLSADNSYYSDCASIVYKSPHNSRLEACWNEELIDLVKRNMNRFSFLQGYSYHV